MNLSDFSHSHAAGGKLSLILASGSDTRRRMLERLGIDFMVIPPKVDEEELKNNIKDLSLIDQGIYLAQAKARSISSEHPQSLVIGADQICEFNGTALDKPGSYDNCIKHLSMLRGHTHYQHCAACIYKNGELIWQYQDSAKLTMRQLSDEEIQAYVELEQPYNSCGSYMFERNGKSLFAEVEGEEDIILGLPIKAMLPIITK